jgi:hypothetical protein
MKARRGDSKFCKTMTIGTDRFGTFELFKL